MILRPCLLAACLTLSFLQGCVTHTPADYLTLRSPAQAVVRDDAAAISVGPVRLPDYLKRNSLARQDDKGHLHFSETEIWAEPLDRGLQRTLVEVLSDALGDTPVAWFPGQPMVRTDYGVSVSVRLFEVTDSRVTLTATWRMLPTRADAPGATISGRFRRERALQQPSSGPEIAEALSELVQALALDIANAVPSRPSADA